MTDLRRTEADAIRDLALSSRLALQDQGHGGNVHVAIVPEGASTAVLDLERFDFVPDRPRGTVRVTDVQSFVDVVKRYDVGDRPITIWARATEGKVVAVFNDHPPEGAGWGDHRAELILEHTLEWQHWKARDGSIGSQEEFANHVEVGSDEIRVPDAALMLEIAQTFHATSHGTFRQATRLQDGTIGLRWEEDVDARAGQAGDAEIPKEMILGLAPFIGEDAYAVTARIRYRVRDGRLAIGYALDRPDAVVRDALDAIRIRIKDRTGLPVYVGHAANPIGSR